VLGSRAANGASLPSTAGMIRPAADFHTHSVNSRGRSFNLQPGRCFFPWVRVGDVIMRKMYRTLAIRTSSDERALRFALLTLAVSLFAALLFRHIIA
jgi:hypothetical protein